MLCDRLLPAPRNRARPMKPSISPKSRRAAIKVDPVETRDFEVFKTSVGTIDFNEDLLV